MARPFHEGAEPAVFDGAEMHPPTCAHHSTLIDKKAVTVPSSLAGLPAISVPAGADDQGLPWGLQVLAPHWAEDTMFRFAARIERQAAGGTAA